MDVLTKDGAAAEPGYVDGKRDGYTPAQRFFIAFGQVVVPEPDRAVGAGAGEDRSAQSGTVADQWFGAELRRVRQGVWLQGWPADDAGEWGLPYLVELKKPSRKASDFGPGLFFCSPNDPCGVETISETSLEAEMNAAKIGVKSLYLLQSDLGFVLPLIQVSLFEQASLATPGRG